MNYLQRWFCRRAARVERFLFACTALLLALLLLGQVLMLNEKVRSVISRVDSLEGYPYRGLDHE
ncbi:MAG: hypothetical protein GX890_01390 [Firmicutes bacterium]|nr:hypothetical protein [Bacillota bacterium]HPU00321.1 hypothetical protein [Bacillota bacterium]